jgi:hypothetical protein
MSLPTSSPPSARGLHRKDGGHGCSPFRARMVSGVEAPTSPRGSPPRTPCCCCGTWGWTRRARKPAARWQSSVTTAGGRRAASPTSGEVEPCINGTAVALGSYFGQDVQGVVDRLLGEQLSDGGWNCEAENGSTRSSFHTTICVLGGLLEHERTMGGSVEVTAARLGGEEYLLRRRMFRRLSTGEVEDPAWTLFSFPARWYYDVLRGLDYLRTAGVVPDERCAEAIDLVEKKRHRDGRWLLENPHPGQVHFDMEDGAGRPSRWNTLRAMRVLDWYEHGPGSEGASGRVSTSPQDVSPKNS